MSDTSGCDRIPDMRYAVIKLQGHQYKVSEKDEILVDKLYTDKLEPEVLLLSEDGKVKVGKPTVKGVKVTFKVIEAEVKGDKLYVSKYKAKSRERRRIGFRPKYTKLLVQSIS